MHESPATEAVADVVQSRPFGWVARVGLTARAVVYLIIGWLAILAARGEPTQVDQGGALTTLIAEPLGGLWVLLLAFGFGAYALWRLSEVIVGVTGEPDGTVPRLVSLIRGIAYAALTVLAVSVFAGTRQTQEGKQEQVAGSVMVSSGGRLLVALAGLALVGVGIYQIRQGLTTRFIRLFPRLHDGRRTAVVWLGRVGTTARGVVFGAAGALMVIAAWRADPSRAGGTDDAVHTLLSVTWGMAIVLILGVGLVIFGLYGLAEAAWRSVPEDESP